MDDITLEKIKSRIRENLKRVNNQYPNKKFDISNKTNESIPYTVITPTVKAHSTKKIGIPFSGNMGQNMLRL
jgi:hypothetical protein